MIRFVVGIFLIVFITTLNCNGQRRGRKSSSDMSIGIVAALGVSKFNSLVELNGSENFENTTTQIGSFGIRTRTKLVEQIFWQAELLYTFRGGATRLKNTSVNNVNLSTGATEDEYFDNIFLLDYLEFPLLIGMSTSKNTRKSKFFADFSTGLAPSINTRSKLRFNNFTGTNGPIVLEEYETTDFDHARTVLINWLFDVTFNFASNSNRNWAAGLKISQSLSDPYSSSPEDSNLETKMTTFIFSLAFMIK